MAKNVVFNSAFVGNVDVLDVLIQGKYVESPQKKTKFEESVDEATLVVVYQISGMNGTGYDITYTCTSDGEAKEDAKQKSVVSGKISTGGSKKVTLKIKL